MNRAAGQGPSTHCAVTLLLLLLALLSWGCRTPGSGGMDSVEGPSRIDGVRGSAQALPFLLPANALGEHFVLRQTVTVRWRDTDGEAQEASFDAAVQRQDESLLLLGLSPMGGVGFSLRLAEAQVSFENRTGRELPFAPARMLADVQRVYYPWLADVAVCDDCVRRGVQGGVEIEEERVRGGVVRRYFRTVVPDSEATGEPGPGARVRGAERMGIMVRYSGEPVLGGVPLNALLRHEVFGYEVELDSLGIDWIE